MVAYWKFIPFFLVTFIIFATGAMPTWFTGGCFVFGIVCLLWVYMNGHHPESVDSDMRDKYSKFKYSNLYDGTGIGLDTENRLVYVFRGNLEKVYKYSDIRSWESSHTTSAGGHKYVVDDAKDAAAAEAESGLYLKVRDIDYPKWRIAFEKSSREYFLSRWMEILNQELNERPSYEPEPSTKSVPLERNCNKCGSVLAEGDRFCSECGQPR